MPKEAIQKFNNWMSKILGIDFGLYVSHGMWSTLPLVLEGIMATALTIAFTRMLPQETFGAYKLYLSIIIMVGVVSLNHMTTAMVQSIGKGYEPLNQMIRYRATASLAGSLMLVLVAAYFHYFTNNGLSIFFLLGAIIFPVLFSFKGSSSYMVGRGDYREACFYEVLRIVIRYVPLFFIYLFSNSLGFLIPLTLVCISLSGIIPFRLMKKKTHRTGEEDPGLLKYGFHLSLLNALPMISENIDKVIMAGVLGYEGVAIWAVAYGLGSVQQQIRGPIRMVLLPKFSKANISTVYTWIRKKVWVLSGAGMVCSLIIVSLLRPAMLIVFPESYGASILPAQIVTFAFSGFVLNEVLATYFISQKNTGSLYKLTMISHGVNILGYLVFIPIWNYAGAMVALYVTNVFCVFYGWHLLKKEVSKVIKPTMGDLNAA